MKKFLLSCLCALGVMTASSAAEATFTFTGDQAYGMTLLSGSTSEYNADPFTATVDNVTLTLTGQTRWWAANTGNELRFYKESSLSLSVPEGQQIQSVVLDAKASTNFAADGYADGTWTGSAQSVTINCTITKSNTPIYSIKVVYGGEGETPDTPVESNIGLYTSTTTVADGQYLLYANNSVATPLTKGYGYISVVEAAVVDGTITISKDNQFTIKAADGGYTIQDPEGMYYYMTGTYNSFNRAAELPEEGAIWSITPNEDGTVIIANVLKEKTIQYDTTYGSYGSYPDVRGIYPALYVFTKDAEATPDTPDTPDEPEPELPVLENLTSLSDLENNTEFVVGMDLTVIFSSGAYTYVTDGISNALIYKYDLGLTVRDVIAKGWKGKLSIYSNLLEIVPNETLTLASTGAPVPAPLEIEPGDESAFLMASNQAAYLTLMGVVFAEPTAEKGSYTGTMGETTVQFYNRFSDPVYEAGTYDVTGFVAVYKDAVQIYPTAFVPSESSAITGIAADNAPTKYYNLQGIEVAAPQAGKVYIRVQGNVASKVVK